MKVLCYDCFSGISGDMNLGAMIDLGIDISYLNSELGKLNLRGWELVAGKDQRHGITGTKVTVRQTIHEHAHRHLSDIEKIIMESSLPEAVKKLSMNIFMKIATAEASVHGIGVDEVHFHEVVAIDSIIDIACAAICFNALNVGAVYVSEVELGGGFVNCDHGKLPVPAPATAEIIKGIPVRIGGVDFEATTPTGAAILSALGTKFSGRSHVKIEKTGYGVGHKDHPKVPNLLRVFLGETYETEGPGHKALLIESNIDDMNPEFYDHISDRLFKAGASDVYFSQIIMKKGRPGVVLNVICEHGLEDMVREIIFTESTTLGIRTSEFKKDTLAREFSKVDTVYGEVTIKRSFYRGNEVSVKPEYEECRRIASERNIPIKEVYYNIMSLIMQKK
ncbi:MAG: nickel pincer cofactor biosynthesis protein LarC [Bacteroidia bacterium]|nr:MAG: nickel pincer cofactor biosynthesis protein LarC [Bacteroidia bacterium]